MSSSLQDLTSLLRDQIHQLQKPRKISNSASALDSRKTTENQLKLTLLRLRAALRSTREAQQAVAAAAEAQAQELPREFVRLRLSEFHRNQLQAAVDRLRSQKYPELEQALATISEQISDQNLLDFLASELTRREKLQETLATLEDERKFLEAEIRQNQELSRKFFEKISALDELLKSLRLVAGEVEEEISDLPDILHILAEKLKLSDITFEISDHKIVLLDGELVAEISDHKLLVTGNLFVTELVARKFGAEWAEKFPITTREIFQEAKRATETWAALRRERETLLTHPEKLVDRKIYKISARALDDVGMNFRVSKTSDDKIFAEISVHEKFPSLHISKSLHGQQASSEGAVVDSSLSEIVSDLGLSDISELSLTEIFATVLRRLDLNRS